MSQVPQIAPLPPAPRRSDAPEDFSAKADALAAAQPGFVSQANALAAFVHQRGSSAEQAATSASGSAAAAAASALAASNSDVSAGNSAAFSAEKAAAAAESAYSASSSAQTAQTAAQTASAAAQATADGLAAIAGGPVASVAGLSGVVTLAGLSAAGVATGAQLQAEAQARQQVDQSLQQAINGKQPSMTTATTAEMQAGTVTGLRAMSPSLVAQAIGALAGSKLVYRQRSSNQQITAADNATIFEVLSGTFTQSFAACSTLGSGWFCYIRNAGSGTVTLDPDGSEQIDSRLSFPMYPGEMRLIQCDGSRLRSWVLNSFYAVFTASGTLVVPPGYTAFQGLLWGAGGGGGSYSGGGGGGCTPFTLPVPGSSTMSLVIGAGGGRVISAWQYGGTGGQSSFESVSAFGGGGGGPDSISGGGGGGAISQGEVGGNGGRPDGGTTSTARPDSAYGGGVGGTTVGSGSSFYGGGGGFAGNGVTNAGSSVYGGGGGGGAAGSHVGMSQHGGRGGTTGADGVAPGGGGGGGVASGAGARGELRIWGII